MDEEPYFITCDDGALIHIDPKPKVERVAAELLDALKDMVAVYWCGCKHPFCRACERTIKYSKLIATAEGKE